MVAERSKIDRINKIYRIEGKKALDRRDMNYTKGYFSIVAGYCFMSFMLLLSKFPSP